MSQLKETGIAANLCNRRFAGIEREIEFCEMAKARRIELDKPGVRANLINHIEDLQFDIPTNVVSEDELHYGRLPFVD